MNQPMTQLRPLSEFIPYFKILMTQQKQMELLNVMKKDALYAPTKKPSDSAQIINAELSKDGTISTYMLGEKYPCKAYPDIQTVWFTAYYKNFVPLLANSLAGQNWFQRIITVLSLKYNYQIFPEWFIRMSKMGKFLLKDEYWSKPVKEFRRVSKSLLDNEMLDALSLVLEYDSAYRFMFQDIVPLLDKKEFEINPLKEMQRLFDIFISRNLGGEQKMINMFRFLKLYLRFNRKLLKQIKTVVADLRIEEITPSKEDEYWMLYLRAYKCFGLEPEEAQKKYLEIKNS